MSTIVVPFWRQALLTLTDGTVTAVAVDGHTVATTSGVTVAVPSGRHITLTYTTTPTCTWVPL